MVYISVLKSVRFVPLILMAIRLDNSIVLALKHVISDLENINVLHTIKTDYSNVGTNILISNFIDYSLSLFESFLENKKYFHNEAKNCSCYKCKTIGYDDFARNFHDIDVNIRFVIEEFLKIQDFIIEWSRAKNYDPSTIEDRTYILRFNKFLKYFFDEFLYITTNKTDVAKYLCQDECCSDLQSIFEKKLSFSNEK